MARSVTWASLKSQARALADEQTNTPTTAFVTDAVLLGFGNGSIGRWHSMLVKAVPERFEASSPHTPTITGATSYALPSDHYLTLGVRRVDGTTETELPRIQYQERTKYSTAAGPAEAYYLKAATLALVPPPASGTYKHHYITAASVMAADGDTLDGVNGWERWIVYDMAIQMVLKAEGDPTALLAERQKIEDEIKGAGSDRDVTNPRRIVDTRLRRSYEAKRRPSPPS